MKNKCLTCGKNCEGSYCFLHKERKPMKKSRFPISVKPKEDKPEISEMNQFFLSIWNSKPHISELSGEILYSPVSSAYFHHILSKEKYPKLKFCKDNIILLSLQEHENVENDMYKYEEINRRRILLKIKYDII